MTDAASALHAHLKTGATTVCRCWHIRRRDGTDLGFTDHDGTIAFDGVQFRAETGLSAQALEQGTGLAVDNAEGVGVLSDAAIREEDVIAGRFDDAAVTLWLVNWADPGERCILFKGRIGEVGRGGGAFRAELRGMSEALNQVRGNVFQRLCNADLGDAACKVDLSRADLSQEVQLSEDAEGAVLMVTSAGNLRDGWFERGRLIALDGAAEGLAAFIKSDDRRPGGRALMLWQSLRAPLRAGDRVRLEAGCDKRMRTCRSKFDNLLNFRGFPHVPGEDWTMAYPRESGRNTGGKR